MNNIYRQKSASQDIDVLDFAYPKLDGQPTRNLLDYSILQPEYAPVSYNSYGDSFAVALLNGLAPIGHFPHHPGPNMGHAEVSPVANLGNPMPLYPVKQEEQEMANLPLANYPLSPPLRSGSHYSGAFASGKREKARVKLAHNVIEQRYRNKINDKFTALQNSVPTLRVLARKSSRGRSDDEDDDEEELSTHDGDLAEDLEGLEPARKLNKGTILAKSVEYIKFLERKNDRMRMVHQQLVERARMLGIPLDEELLARRV